MGRIFLVRHGQDTDNVAGRLNGHRNTNLTELGKKQAQEAAEKLRGRKIDFIYSSPLKRTLQTAHYIVEVISAELIIDENLIERDFGKLTGTFYLKDKARVATKVFTCEKGTFVLEGDGVETFEEVLVRAKEFLEDVKWWHRDKNIVIVTHGDTGKMIQAAHFGWSIDEALRKPYLQNAEVLKLV